MNPEKLAERVRQGALRARETIAPYVLRTPTVPSARLSRRTGANVFLKLEHLQHTGSFKLRGAAHAVLSHGPRGRGVVAASTGNHGMAVAYACRALNEPAEVFVPEGAETNKVRGIADLGGAVRAVGKHCLDAELAARAYAEREGKYFVSPYNDLRVVEGQGTLGLELSEEIPESSTVLVAAGGGGLVSGIAACTRSRVVGIQPVRSAVLSEWIKKGAPHAVPELPTLSDATAGSLEEDTLTLPLSKHLVDEWGRVTEDEIVHAGRVLWDDERCLVEGAALLPLAFLLQAASRYQGENVVLVLCGRNASASLVQKIAAI